VLLAPSGLVDLELDEDGLARILFGTPEHAPGVLSLDLLAALEARIAEVETGASEGRVRVVLVGARARGAFIAASDLRPLRGLTRAGAAAEHALGAQRVLRRLEQLPVPTIALLDGVCEGAGLELALACSYRIASDSPRTRIGLPEVRTGLIPGFGGTVRLPRLIGIQPALEMILTGRPVDAAEALRIGLVDDTAPARTLQTAGERFARERADGIRLRSGRRRRVRRRLVEDTAPGRRLLFLRAARRLIPDSTLEDAAPNRALEAVAEGLALPLDRAFRREAKIFGQLAVSADAQALIHTHLLLDSAATATPTAPTAAPPQAAVLGAGEVGTAFAYLLARRGIPVRLKDRERAAMAAGAQAAGERLSRERRPVRRRSAAVAAPAVVTTATGFGGFGTLDFVALAVGHRPDTIRLALQEVEEHTGEQCVVAVTSALIPVDAVQRAALVPSRVIGYHLALPVGPFPLVEIVPGPETDSATLARALDLTRKIGRTPVLAADRPGFLLPRLLASFFSEALRLLDEGAGIEQIDAAVEDAGFIMGPFRRIDGFGAARALRLLDSLVEPHGERFRPAKVAERIRGARDGFYLYRRGRPFLANPALPAGLRDLGEDHAELIRDRILMLLVNEAALALEEGVAEREAIDLTSVLGLGFPRIRGGLLHFAAGLGTERLLDRLDRLATRFGDRFAPAPLLHHIDPPASGHPG
jgi:3-hydroxyacyl-CoA dehydrogenase/enoyl-CoA hydratase/3-hydroxybutyryl-CoA epimerase